MYELVEKQVDEMFQAVLRMDRAKAGRAREEIKKILGKMVNAVDPLQVVCSVPEAAKRLKKGERAVRRMIKGEKLPARKSGGVWLVRL